MHVIPLAALIFQRMQLHFFLTYTVYIYKCCALFSCELEFIHENSAHSILEFVVVRHQQFWDWTRLSSCKCQIYHYVFNESISITTWSKQCMQWRAIYRHFPLTTYKSSWTASFKDSRRKKHKSGLKLILYDCTYYWKDLTIFYNHLWHLWSWEKKTCFILYTFSTISTNVELVAFFWYCFFIFYFLVHHCLWLCMGQFGGSSCIFLHGWRIFDWFLYWDLEIPSMPIRTISSLLNQLMVLYCSLPRSFTTNPPPLPFGPLFFHLNPPHMYSYLSLMSTLGHGDMVPNGISNLCNPMLFL